MKRPGYTKRQLDFINERLRIKRENENKINPQFYLLCRWAMLVGFVFILVFAIDYFLLPTHEIHCTNASVSYEQGGPSYSRKYGYSHTTPPDYFLYADNDRLKINDWLAGKIGSSREVYIEKTLLLHIPSNVKTINGDELAPANIFYIQLLLGGLLFAILAGLRYEQIRFMLPFIVPVVLVAATWLAYW